MVSRIFSAILLGSSPAAFAATSPIGTWTPLEAKCSSGAAYDAGVKPGEQVQEQKAQIVITADEFRVRQQVIYEAPAQPKVFCAITVNFKFSLENDVAKLGQLVDSSSTCPFEIKSDDIQVERTSFKMVADGDTLKFSNIEPMGAGDACPPGDIATTTLVRSK